MPRHRTQTAAGEPSTIKLRAGSWWHKPEKKLRISNAKRGWPCARSGAARGAKASPRIAKESFTLSNLPPSLILLADPAHSKPKPLAAFHQSGASLIPCSGYLYGWEALP